MGKKGKEMKQERKGQNKSRLQNSKECITGKQQKDENETEGSSSNK